MKKILLSLISSVIISSIVHAQIDKGTVLLGGNLYLSKNKSESTDPPSDNYKNETTNFGITPSVGVAIKPNTIVGIQLGYAHGKSSIENSGSDKHESYRTEAFLRKYLTLGKGFYLFAQPGVYYNGYTYEMESSNSKRTIKEWSVGIDLYPGISYALNKRFHLEAGLGNMADLSYGQSKNENKSKPGGETSSSKGHNFEFSSSLSTYTSINIGFRFFLGKRYS
ncbi:hypothetical protein OCK74_05775 [Chitinophagaceae bacterium LB-8]|uniref:Outer membrane protein beta-barrel domain-containing protein n=1 Tax=Paraflavisolibacter caeni TaxID=2982496 RepID=A0A9X3B6X6_9BACT|nr:hypothetical protein [Paraflavisolibacter caeni]MCU7548615.1 hypothetical protein [Paraflavisolibacter caeni]